MVFGHLFWVGYYCSSSMLYLCLCCVFTLATNDNNHCSLDSLSGWDMSGGHTLLHTWSPKLKVVVLEKGWECDRKSCDMSKCEQHLVFILGGGGCIVLNMYEYTWVHRRDIHLNIVVLRIHTINLELKIFMCTCIKHIFKMKYICIQRYLDI